MDAFRSASSAANHNVVFGGAGGGGLGGGGLGGHHQMVGGNESMISRLMDTYMKETQHLVKSIPEIFEIHKHLIHELNSKDMENKEMLEEMRREMAYGLETQRREQRRDYDKDMQIMTLNRKLTSLEHQLAESNERLEAQNRSVVTPLEQQLADTRDQLETKNRLVVSLEQQLADSQRQINANNRQSLEQQLADTNDLLATTNQKVSTLEQQLTETEDRVEAQNREVVSLEQQLSDTKDMLDTERNETEKYRQLSDERQDLLSEINVSNNALTQDLSKANEIIRKLQTEMQSTHQKLLVLNKVTSKQEEAVDLHHNAVQKLDVDLRHCTQQLKQKDREYQSLRKDFDALKAKCGETEAQLTANQNIISYLNQQISGLQAKHGIRSSNVTKEATHSSATNPKIIAQRNAVFSNKTTNNDNLFRR